MTSNVIRCSMLFDALGEKKSQLWIANTILLLDVSDNVKIKLAQKLVKEEEALEWFMEQLEEDKNDDVG